MENLCVFFYLNLMGIIRLYMLKAFPRQVQINFHLILKEVAFTLGILTPLLVTPFALTRSQHATLKQASITMNKFRFPLMPFR